MKNGSGIYILIAILYAAATLQFTAAGYAVTITDIVFEDTADTVKTVAYPGDTIIIRTVVDNTQVPDILIVTGRITSELWSEDLDPQPVCGIQGTTAAPQWRLTLPLVVGTQLQVKLTGRSLRQSDVTLYKRLPVAAQSDEYIDENLCSSCHRDTVEAWKRSRHYPEITCQICHGPAGEHILAPGDETTIASAGNVTCTSFCHNRTEGNYLNAVSGFIAPFQETYEVRHSPHAGIGGCLTCHNPHEGPSSGAARAIRTPCITCHRDKKIGMAMEMLNCKDCHMPFAVSTDPSLTHTLHQEGTMRSHIFRIKGTAAPRQMIGSGSDRVNRDGAGLFLSLDFACLGCHDGKDAVRLDMTRARQAHTIVHE